jgi:serine/threonine protein kinase
MMALQIGSRLGSYEITAHIGVGGMGEVYRARDSRLNRDIALKVLPEAFTRDSDRLARFEREAQVLASLNHPNIGAIYGFEESNSSTSSGQAAIQALVLELVEGPTLADRIAQGPLPLDEALPIAKQIADSLEAAHEQGIIHRDLKPANIKVRPDGAVKVLDWPETGVASARTGCALTLLLGSCRASVSMVMVPRSFIRRDLIGVMENQDGDLPTSVCLVQHVRNTSAFQLLSVDLVPYRNACDQCRVRTQRFDISHAQLTPTKPSGSEAFHARRKRSCQDGAGRRGEDPLWSHEQRRLMKVRQHRLDIESTEGGVIVSEHSDYVCFVIHGVGPLDF